MVTDCSCFFFNGTATTEIYTLSLHDALPILRVAMLDDPGRYPEARIFPCDVVERGTLRPLP